MIVYRFAHYLFADDLTGTNVLYTSGTISLSLLEILVNAGSFEALQPFRLIQLTIPDTAIKYQINTKNLKKNWHQDIGYTQWMGSEILQEKKALVIECPSVIIPQESNFLLNPLHKDFNKIRMKEVSDFSFDERLFPLVNR
jgi:RES domain-containing protein